MKELIELNGRLNRQLGKGFPEGWLLLGRNDQPKALKGLPGKWQKQIEALRTRINSVMPDDFNYALCLGGGEPSFVLEYENGPQTRFAGNQPWRADRLLLGQLKKFDWQAERNRALGSTQVFDALIEKARHLPARLPSTKELQTVFRSEMEQFVQQRKNARKVHVLTWRAEEAMQEECYNNMKSFAWDLPNLMTVQYRVITVVMDGKPLPVRELDKLKRQALKALASMPISHARALGKF